jgi:hypothetical protein
LLLQHLSNTFVSQGQDEIVFLIAPGGTQPASEDEDVDGFWKKINGSLRSQTALDHAVRLASRAACSADQH